MKGINIFLADGFEEIEALATRDVLIRGGVDVNLVSIAEEPLVTSAHGLTVASDALLSDLEPDNSCSEDDVMVFPGGMPGSKNLGDCSALIDLMNAHYAAGGTVAAICAAPKFVFGQLSGIENAEFTCYEGCQDELVAKGAKFLRRSSVRSGRIITGRGPGCAIDFALEILSLIKGKAVADEVALAMFYSRTACYFPMV